MKSADVFEQIEKMGGLPSLPQTLLNIQKVANDNRSSAEDLAECILRDQALTMRVLKVVNSVMYQRRNREQVRTVRRAVIVMGFNAVRQLALGLSVFDMMSKLSRSPQLVHIARHSLVTAGFAQVLSPFALGALFYTSLNSLGWAFARKDRFSYAVPMLVGVVVAVFSLVVLLR